jgi:histidinol dehydrogenase
MCGPRGDAAVVELTNRFDKSGVDETTLAFDPDEIEAAYKRTSQEVRDALHFAHDRIRAHHEKQKPADQLYVDATGVTLGARWTAVDAVGLYVPGGLASYPSSVLMNAIPARVAGAQRIAMVVPTPNGQYVSAVLAAAHIAGISEIYRIGGAQAVAALAYGTKTIARVDKIVGPGNAYVAAAKRQVFGQVGIDLIAGPSEVLVIADRTANPAWVAADLIAQGRARQRRAIDFSSPTITRWQVRFRPKFCGRSRYCRIPKRRATAGSSSAPSSRCPTSKRRCRSPTASPPSMSN